METLQSTDTMIIKEKDVVKIRKWRLIAGAFVVLVVIFLVGILSGILSAKHEREKVEEKYASKKVKRDGMFHCPFTT